MNLKITRFLVLVFALISQLILAQEKTASGIVTDVSGLPLPGVNVLVKGTKKGTQTDFDGAFKIQASQGETLVFSFLGMKTTELPAGTNMKVKLTDDSVKLSDVVVTSLGIKREKKSLGYATQELKAEDINSGAGSGNFINELSGKVAGVNIKRNTNFGGSSSIVSRGVKSLKGNNEMLIVIDGLPINNSNVNSTNTTNSGAGGTANQGGGAGNTYDYGNAAMDINPDDIESVNILKGAAASALYGYLGGNGVVIITTKKGRSGKGKGITISSEFITGNLDKSTFPIYQNKYGAGYGPFYADESGYFDVADVNGDGIDDLVVPTYEDASFGAAFNPNTLVYQWNAFTPYSDSYKKATLWLAPKNGPISFFETPATFNNSVSLENGNDKTNFVLNFNNYKQNGILPNSELKKNSLSAKLSHQFSDKLSVNVFANYLAQNTAGRNSTGYNENILTNFRQWWQTNVDVQELKQVFERSGGQNINWNYSNPVSNLSQIYWDNPYFIRYKNFQSDERNRFTGYSNLNYKFTDWLTATGKISTDTYSELREERRAVGSLPGAFGINRLDEKSGYQKYNRSFSEQNYDLILTIKKNISENFSFNGILGGTIVRTRVATTLNSTQGGLIVPGIYSLSNSTASVPFPLESEVNSGINSYYASTSFGYKDILFLDATARRDAFSQLPKNDNVIPSYSISGSYVFTKSIDMPWLSFGKIRGGYSESPLGTPNQSLIDTYFKIDPFGTNQQYSVPSIRNNPELKGVTTFTQEAGIEMQFLNKRLGFDVGVYKNVNEGEAFEVPFSTATGYTSKFVNAATVINKGIEVQFNVTPIKTNDFTWDVFINWSKNNNTVEKLAPGIENLLLTSFQGGVTLNATEGSPYGVIKGTDFVYLNGQKVVGTDGRYKINASTNNIIGNVNPDWLGGIRNKFSYKTISLGFLIDMKRGGDIFSLDQYYGQATGIYAESAGNNDLGNPIRNTIANGGGIILPGVQADGTPNTIRTIQPDQFGNVQGYRRAPNKAFIYDASFIKLREVSITYSLPESVVSRLKLSQMTFSLIGSNLWIIDKNLPYADPESGLSSSALSSGYSVGSLPTTRNFGGNITFKF
jgi:TonB-linked SusC/RagA family outer membrane protein